jgi:sporulation protein YlmC with PRC-barrel domain
VKPDGSLKLVGEVRDLQIVDASGKRCGICDDVEFEGTVGDVLEVAALVVGPGAYARRLPRSIFWLLKAIAGYHETKVPWKAVSRITSTIELDKNAAAYGLRKIEDKLERLMSAIPGARS